MVAYKHKWIANFWIRLGALLIDSLLLAVLGIVLSFFLEDTFVQLGAMGRIIGFIIALLYFSVLNSRIAGGQTLGKKALHLRVVDANNEPVALISSVIRFLILGVPVFLSSARLPDVFSSSWLSYPLALVVIGGLLSSFYLYVFNRRSRQSLHDLVAGTYVVYVDTEKQETMPVWSAHFIVVVFLFIFAIMFSFTANSVASQRSYQSLHTVQSRLAEQPIISSALVSAGVSVGQSQQGEPEQLTYVVAQVFLKQNRLAEAELAQGIARDIVAQYPDAAGKDTMRIVLVYGFDIGIWSHWLKQAYDFNPAQLK